MAKYDSLRKPEKKRLVREYHESHPELSYVEVGTVFRIDAAWVWRICHERSDGDKANPPKHDTLAKQQPLASSGVPQAKVPPVHIQRQRKSEG